MTPHHTHDPRTSPSWRWELALRCAADGPDKMLDDLAVAAAVSYLKRDLGLARDRCRHCLSWQDVSEARCLFQQAGLLKAEINARLIAGESDEQIGRRCDVPARIIGCYALLFFCVRDFPRATDWLLSRVIGPGPQRGFQDADVDRFWAWMAFSGPLVLDAVIGAFHRARRPGEPETLSVYLRSDRGVPLPLQAVVAVAVLPVPTPDAGGPIGQLWLEMGLASQVTQPIVVEPLMRTTVRAAQAFLGGDSKLLQHVAESQRRETRTAAGIAAPDRRRGRDRRSATSRRSSTIIHDSVPRQDAVQTSSDGAK